MSLSDSWLKANHGKAVPKRYEKADRDGLSVRVSAGGKITFQIRFRYAGKQQRCDLGSYPLTSLKDARTECMRYRAELEQGNDPRMVKAIERQDKLSQNTVNTVAGVFERWLHEVAIRKNKQAHHLYKSVEKHLLPKLGHLPVDKVHLDLWLLAIEPVAELTPSMAGRLLSQSKSMLSWAVKRNLVTNNVLMQIGAHSDLHIERKARDRILNDEELGWLFEYFEQARFAEPKNLLFMQLCLLYGCRNGELRNAKKADIDLAAGIWTVPAENRKGRKKDGPLLRPIPTEFKPLFERLMPLSDSKYLIPVRGRDAALTSSASISLPFKVMNWVRKHKQADMPHWTLHDLRRTARTHFSSLTDPHIAEIMLDHTLPGVWRVYDKSNYLPEQMRAYEAWYRKLMVITGEADDNRVVELRTPA